jgi:FtsZ-binding cell division protein ZapB
MNIYTVRDNLKNTIAGKEKMLAEYNKAVSKYDDSLNVGAEMAVRATISFLEINIDELKRILQDVEKCVEEFEVLKEDLSEANGRVRQLERQASDDSWEGSVDRMSGAFDESELRGRDGWL